MKGNNSRRWRWLVLQVAMGLSTLLLCTGQSCVQRPLVDGLDDEDDEQVAGYIPPDPNLNSDPTSTDGSDQSTDQQSPTLSLQAGKDQQVFSGDTVTLTAQCSLSSDQVQFHWTQTSGTAVQLTQEEEATANFVAPLPLAGTETLTFEITAQALAPTNASPSIASSTVSIEVQESPLERIRQIQFSVIDASTAQPITTGTPPLSSLLVASVSDGGELPKADYCWNIRVNGSDTQLCGPASTHAQVAYNFDTAGEYTISLAVVADAVRVNCNNTETATTTTTITIKDSEFLPGGNGSVAGEETPTPVPYPTRWIYMDTNLYDTESRNTAISVVQRAAAAGFNGVVLADAKFMLLKKYGLDAPNHPYRQCFQTFQKACQDAGMEIIPFISTLTLGLLEYDPNLAEGYEVRDLLLEVQNSIASHVPDSEVTLTNGDFESLATGEKDYQFTGWTYQDLPGQASTVDETNPDDGQRCIQFNPAGMAANECRIRQTVPVKPHRYYRFSVQVKTENLTPTSSCGITIEGTNNGEPLSLIYPQLTVQATQDWSTLEVFFNSLESSEITIWLGLWDVTSGTIWMDHAAIQELGPMNVIRRSGCPVTITLMDGTVLEEGADYEEVVDPALGNAPNGEMYDRYHDPITIQMIRNLPDGTQLKMSYYHPLIVYARQVDPCMSEPKTYEIWRELFTRLDDFVGQSDKYFIGFSEQREGNSCAACKARGLTAGQLMADSIAQFTDIVRDVNSQSQIYVWHDMFYPGHAAKSNYFFMLGDGVGSWLGLDSDITVVSWGYPQRASMAFFAEPAHAHPQIASVDIRAVDRLLNGDLTTFMGNWFDAMDAADNTQGIMFTTWTKNYSRLEEFAQIMMQHSQPTP